MYTFTLKSCASLHRKSVTIGPVRQSPCTNGCDLGFNKSLDSRLPRVRDFDLDRFEEQILEAWEEYPGEKLHDLFDMKSRVLECILTSDPPGGNSFKLPHRSANEK